MSAEASPDGARRGEITRRTRETEIAAAVDLDGGGQADIATGVGFFDHMLAQLARHSRIGLTLRASGDTGVDDHHTVEDCGLALGQALSRALGDMAGLQRYGHAYVPMDEALVRCCLDLSGRAHLTWRVAFPAEKIGSFDTELAGEFFRALANQAGMTIHVHALEGANSHHLCEAAFKALARALATATAGDPALGGAIASTKGRLGG